MGDRDQRILRAAGRPGAAVAELDSPAVPETLGRALAEQLRRYRPDAVVFWCTPEAAVLAHVVARELGADVLAADEDQGRLTLDRRPTAGATVVAVDVEWVDRPGLFPLVRTVVGAGAQVVAAAAVLHTEADEAAGVPLHVLETSAPWREQGGAT
jgi:hypothetical protein